MGELSPALPSVQRHQEEKRRRETAIARFLSTLKNKFQAPSPLPPPTAASSPPLDKATKLDITLNYLRRDHTEKPTFVSVTTRGVFDSSNVALSPHAHTVTDLRGHEASFSLDQNGFAFVGHSCPEEVLDAIRSSTNNDGDGEKDIEERYYPLVEQLLKDHTGADKVHIFEHLVRKSGGGGEGGEGGGRGGARQPALRVHIDQLSSNPNNFQAPFAPKTICRIEQKARSSGSPEKLTRLATGRSRLASDESCTTSRKRQRSCSKAVAR